MRLGLLECDHVADRHRPIDGDYADMFRALVLAHAPDAEVVGYDARHGVLPAETGECDGWILTGSRASVYDDETWIRDLSELVRQLDADRAPTVGICFGHQLLAHALGGRTERAAAWGVGALPMDVLESPSWMSPPQATTTLLYSHQDQVTALPDGARLLGRAPHCPIAMFALGDHGVGLQAHPEFSHAYLAALVGGRVDRIGPARTAAALASLVQPTDSATVGRWLVGFLAARRTPGRG